eukprot:373004-Pleurochrysis_carterae.AAC.1
MPAWSAFLWCGALVGSSGALRCAPACNSRQVKQLVDIIDKSEWGPWKNAVDTRFDDFTNQMETKQVLRTLPDGVPFMNGYPDVENDPGAKEWLESDKWSMRRVFECLKKNWQFDNTAHQDDIRRTWRALRRWQTAYSTSDSLVLGQRHVVGEGLCNSGRLLSPLVAPDVAAA